MSNTKSVLRAGVGAVAGVLVWVAAVSSAAAQSLPNFEGVWKIASPTQTLKPVSGDVPFTAKGREAYNENKKLKASKKYDDYDITMSRCSNPGVPRLMLTSKRFKIWNRQKVMTFDFEWNRAIRQIDMRGVKVESPLVPTMTGLSVGKWEGDMLVATTTDVSDRTLIDDLTPHGYDLKVTERYRLVDANTLENRITIEDPEYFTKSWEAVLTFKKQPDALFPEDVCLDRIQAKKPTPAWP
jgi:hypothetical protein